MKKKLIKYLQSNKSRKLIRNFSYLSIISIANKALPLIVVPYIVTTIGIEKFGIITFAFAFANYFMLIPQYSFELTSTKFISVHRDDIKKISQHFSTVMVTKLLLLLFVSILFMLILFSFEKFYLEKEVFLYTFIFIIAQTIMPLWFFMGIEEMKYIAIFNIISKGFYTLLVFILIESETDYIWIPLLNSITFLAISLYSIYFIKKNFHIFFIKPKLQDIKDELKEGRDIFLSNMSVSLYTSINTILLGLLSTYTVVGIYSLAEAIYYAYTSIIKSYPTVVYPYLARYIDNRSKLYSEAKKFFIFYLLLLMSASLFLYLLSNSIITILYGEGHEESIYLLQILSIALLLEPLGSFFTPYLSLKSEYKTIRNITFKVMLLNLLLVIPFILVFEGRSIAYLLLILSLAQVYLNLSHNKELLKFRRKI